LGFFPPSSSSSLLLAPLSSASLLYVLSGNLDFGLLRFDKSKIKVPQQQCVILGIYLEF
jgi:hypothetical protein